MSSTTALAGISGYDFSGIVQAMVTSYSRPLTKMQDRMDSLEATQGAWRDLNTRLSALENTLADLRTASTWKGTSAASGNTSILEATGGSGAAKGTYLVKVVRLATVQTAASAVQNVASADTATTVAAGTFKITVGEDSADITVAAGASLNDIAGSINNADIGVNASVVAVNGGYRLAVVSAETGIEKAATFADTSGNVLQTLGVLNSDGTLNTTQAAQDAEIEVNGISGITSSSNTITSAISGVTLNLNAEAPATSVKVTVGADYTDAQKAVQSFVDQYNSLMTLIEDDLAYNADSDKKGALYADPTVQNIQSRLRTMVSSSMGFTSGTFKILSELGISTSGDNFGKSAVLEFDTDKFTAALAKDADSVANLFGAAAGGVTPVKESDGTEKAQGLANILEEYLYPLVKYDGIMDRTEAGYDSQITGLKSDISEFQTKIDAYTERMNLKFAALETQLSALNSQSDYLTSILSSLSDSSNNNKK